MVTLQLTEEERNRICAVIAYNLDANLIPDMTSSKDPEHILALAKTVEFDRALNQKLLNTDSPF